jgi:hypothetical protein
MRFPRLTIGRSMAAALIIGAAAFVVSYPGMSDRDRLVWKQMGLVCGLPVLLSAALVFAIVVASRR